MALKPIGTCITQTTSSGSVVTGPIAHRSDTLRCHTLTKEAHVKVSLGANPTASAEDFYIPANTSASLSISAPSSNRVVGITTGATTIIDFAQGTGSPFGVGDAVTLTCAEQSTYDFTHKLVTDVNTSSGVDGYFSTRITVNNDSSTGNPAELLSTSYAELRSSFKIAAFSSGAGTLLSQQVQITGEG